ncbi:MAG TPA: SMP-30/gluconolactonase/LRE family protein [Solirubrobacteraceae bacterium]|nr:SMP-30/gluconolactonase/LRE family protein [Solirubrobacteraceae bacterium]
MTVEIEDPRLEALIDPDARPRRLWTGGEWVEGPVYVPAEDCVYWSDIPNDRVLRFSESDGASVALHPAGYANGHTLDREGRIVRCEHGRRRVSRVEPDGTLTTIADRYAGGRLNSPNDVVVKSDGTIWFSDPPYGIVSDREGHRADSEQAGCFVFRCDPRDGALAVVSDAFEDPNGLAFSPDESILYVSDTSSARHQPGRHHLFACDVLNGGTRLAPPRPFAVCGHGVFDGFRVDRDGNLWTSAGESVEIYAPDGARLGRIALPEVVSKCTFGGRDGTTLFITATSSLYALVTRTRSAVPTGAGTGSTEPGAGSPR